MKRVLAVLLVICMLPVFSACGKSDTSRNELWIVTEQTTWDRMNGQTAAVMDAFEKQYPDVKLRIDYMPIEEQERSAYLQWLRTQILRGSGPDIYLLPTSTDRVVDAPRGYEYATVEPLFSDVEQAMRNGIFRDISAYYDADETLGKEALQAQVMEAGVLEGIRYVLPLRYDIPVIFADGEAMAQAGVSAQTLEQGIGALMDKVLELQNAEWISSAVYLGTEVFGGWLSYDAQRPDVTAEEIKQYLDQCQQLMQWCDLSALWRTGMNVKSYATTENGPQNAPRYPFYIGNLQDILDYAPIYQYEERPLEMIPLRSMDGQLVANVTYYAAVGATCSDPGLAYEFVRLFLTEESQWEQNRPKSLNAVGFNGRIINTTNASQYPGLIEDGWPVRSAGALNEVWTVRYKQFYSTYYTGGVRTRVRKICLTPIDEENVPVLDVKIDQVRFGTVLTDEFEDLLRGLMDPETGVLASVDTQKLAEDFLWQLRFHVAEG